MTGELRRNKRSDMNICAENCQCSAYTMAAVAGCLLFCLGIIVYALICA